ncbi:enoyl-CoA hydratase [alpha proteobacterium U9-1i]|nr:enoyl-CoA hydratase [alpha proteobacterium U9-1i]
MLGMSYRKITFAIEHGVALVRLNEPKSLNAMSVAMGEELIDAIARAGRQARALCLAGEGRAFCSGANLVEGGINIEDPARDAGVRLETTFNPLILALRNSEVPVVTAIRGAAAGVGCAVALCGDVIIAGESGYFYQAFRHVGLVPDGGSSYLLARAIGRVRAMEMMLLGEKLPAAKALDWGLITRVVPDDELDAAAMTIARQLATGPRALRFIRQQAWAALDAPFEEQLARERGFQREAGRSSDFVEGVMAFREKRSPHFKGE